MRAGQFLPENTFMEYVANAKGQDIAVASSPAASAAKPASVGSNASTVAAGAAPSIASPAPAIIAVTGLSTLEEIQAFYQKEVARVEADAATIKRFAATVIQASHADIAAVKTDVAEVKGLPRAVKLAIAVLIVLAYAGGFATRMFL